MSDPTNIDNVTSDVEAVLTAVGTILAALVPGGVIGGFAISEIVSIAKGVASGIPDVVAAYSDIQAAVNGSAPPTAAQLDALKASVDAADDQLQADVAAADKADPAS